MTRKLQSHNKAASKTEAPKLSVSVEAPSIGETVRAIDAVLTPQENEMQRILRETKALIPSEEFWLRGMLHLRKEQGDCFCVRGAAMRVEKGEDYFGRESLAEKFLAQAARELYPHWDGLRDAYNSSTAGKPEWAHVVVNNHPDTTLPDLHRVIDRAYELAGEGKGAAK
jgi:hypothetical protein